MRFSEYFNLNKSQWDLDFVDVPLDKDIRLFVDPYAISINEEDSDCLTYNEEICSFFDYLLELIIANKKSEAINLLSYLSEPKGTGLGFSKSKDGSGINKKLSEKIYFEIKNSNAFKKGLLSEISECELFIEDFGPDRISDMTIKIILKNLIQYTNLKCTELGIPVRRVGFTFWDSVKRKIISDYVYLPVVDNLPRILIPTKIVRVKFSFNHDELYNMNILDYLKSEHLDSSSALVETLKNGKRRVTKKVLKEQEEYKKSKSFITDIIEQNNSLISEYKFNALEKDRILYSAEIDKVNPEKSKVDITSMIDELKSIPTGTKNADNYHNLIIKILEKVFVNQLINFKKEFPLNNGRKKVDIVATNNSKSGFFHYLSEKHNIKCPYIHIECKNYSDDITNIEIDQLAGRLDPKTGDFGIMCCRSIKDKKKNIELLKYYYPEKYLIVLTDDDIINLINFSVQQMTDIDTNILQYLDEKIRELL